MSSDGCRTWFLSGAVVWPDMLYQFSYRVSKVGFAAFKLQFSMNSLKQSYLLEAYLRSIHGKLV